MNALEWRQGRCLLRTPSPVRPLISSAWPRAGRFEPTGTGLSVGHGAVCYEAVNSDPRGDWQERRL